MTLFEAPVYDAAKARRHRMRIVAAVAVAIVIGIIAWNFRFWPEEHQVNRFFEALEQKDFQRAYSVWMNDPDWQQHPQNYERYPFQSFMQDWGPSGEWGIINRHKIDGAAIPKGYNGSPFIKGSSGVVVVVTVNDRIADKAHIWVQKSDKTLGFSPY
jgi:hypothetical protein